MAEVSPRVPLVLSAAEGATNDISPARLHRMFEAHYDQVHRVLRRLGLSSAQADDAAQEVFCVATQRLGDIVAGSERAFLLGTARRVAAASRRTAARWAPDSHAVEELAHPALEPEQSLTQGQELRLLDAILSELDDDEREVFVLFEIEGIARTEVAALLNMPEGTAASRLTRARKTFLAAAQRHKTRLAREGGAR